MGVYIKNWSLADWKELLMWARIGANNAMIGELTEVEEVPPHGRLGDLDKLADNMRSATAGMQHRAIIMHEIRRAPTIIEAEEGET